MKQTIGVLGLIFGAAIVPAALAAKPLDVGVIGPQGDVMLYYRDGDQIVVKTCAKNTVLGTTTQDARRNCQGVENRVPVNAFKRTLRSLVSLENAGRVKPLTSDQVKALNSGKPPTEDQLAEMQKELDQIEAFIKAYGPENANLGRRDQVASDLAANKLKSSAIKAANDQIDRTIDLISNPSQLTITKHSTDADQFLFTALKQFDASKAECGTDELMNGQRKAPGGGGGGGQPGGSGAQPGAWLENLVMPSAQAAPTARKAASRAPASIGVEDRIKDCSMLPGSSKTTSKSVRWDLVARRRDSSTGKFYEVWKDSKSGLTWGDLLDSNTTHYNAVGMAANGKVAQEKACAPDSEEAKRANARVSEKSFALPTIEEFEAAEKNGVREVVPNMAGYYFWSASLDPFISVARGSSPVIMAIPASSTATSASR